MRALTVPPLNSSLYGKSSMRPFRTHRYFTAALFRESTPRGDGRSRTHDRQPSQSDDTMPVSSIQTQVSKQIDRVSKLMKKHHDDLVAVWTASIRKFHNEQVSSTSTTNKRLVNAHTDTKRKVVPDAKNRVTVDAMKQIAQKKPKCSGRKRRRNKC